MNIERTFPYLNTQMTLTNEKRQKKLLQIKEKPVKKRNKRKTMNIERTFPYLNTQMTLANEKRKKNFCKIKEKTRKEKKQGKNYEH